MFQLSEFIGKYDFGDISVNYILNEYERAVMILLPKDTKCEFFSKKIQRFISVLL